ncbi:MAG: serine/threonine protein kinase [Polyangiaceae bacterium]|nr:serine/threonine protein kinase [Polyangiaceae bacterium]
MSIVVATLAHEYQVLRLLGRGGMGAVFEARQKRTGRRVAVKFMAKILHRDDPRVKRFEREARVAVKLINSKHTARVLAFGEDCATRFPFIVMEYLCGEDLQILINQVGPLPIDVALRVAAQACLGLEKVHKAGVIHRDIKPANLFLAREDTGNVVVKLLDFGIAKIKPNEWEEALAKEIANSGDILDPALAKKSRQFSEKLTRTRGVLGSPPYISPEQLRGEESVDHRTDIWSLGLVLYCALTGRPPSRLSEGFVGEPQPIREIAPWVPAEVSAIVHRAAAALPDERFQSATEMLSAIQILLEGEPILSESMLATLARHRQHSVDGTTSSVDETHTTSAIEENEFDSPEIYNKFWETFNPPLNESRFTELGYDTQLLQRMKTVEPGKEPQLPAALRSISNEQRSHANVDVRRSVAAEVSPTAEGWTSRHNRETPHGEACREEKGLMKKPAASPKLPSRRMNSRLEELALIVCAIIFVGIFLIALALR